jgi:hypothetical protein
MPVDEYVPCSQGNRKTLKYTVIQNIMKTNIMISMPLNLQILYQWYVFVYTDKYMPVAWPQ